MSRAIKSLSQLPGRVKAELLREEGGPAHAKTLEKIEVKLPELLRSGFSHRVVGCFQRLQGKSATPPPPIATSDAFGGAMRSSALSAFDSAVKEYESRFVPESGGVEFRPTENQALLAHFELLSPEDRTPALRILSESGQNTLIEDIIMTHGISPPFTLDDFGALAHARSTEVQLKGFAALGPQDQSAAADSFLAGGEFEVLHEMVSWANQQGVPLALSSEAFLRGARRAALPEDIELLSRLFEKLPIEQQASTFSAVAGMGFPQLHERLAERFKGD